MGNGVPLIVVRAPTSSPFIEVHPIEYIAIDPQLRVLLHIEHIDNTSDYDKPISRATQIALDALSAGGIIGEYLYTQATALTTWNIAHNLGRRPIVQVFTTGWVQIVAQVVNTSNNTTQILFDTAQDGFAVLI